MATPLPRIAVIGTGGTISSLGASSLDVLGYPDFGQKLTCEALLDRFPETRLVAEPVPVTFRQVGSTAIGPEDMPAFGQTSHETLLKLRSARSAALAAATAKKAAALKARAHSGRTR